jgi:hypothetical protein
MFTVQGKVIRNIETKEGISKKGTPYKVSQWLVDIGQGDGKSVIVLKAFGELGDQLQEDYRYNFIFYINTREYNGKYYTELSLKECSILATETAQGCTEYRPGQVSAAEEPETGQESALLSFLEQVDSNEKNDLPF